MYNCLHGDVFSEEKLIHVYERSLLFQRLVTLRSKPGTLRSPTQANLKMVEVALCQAEVTELVRISSDPSLQYNRLLRHY